MLYYLFRCVIWTQITSERLPKHFFLFPLVHVDEAPVRSVEWRVATLIILSETQ